MFQNASFSTDPTASSPVAIELWISSLLHDSSYHLLCLEALDRLDLPDAWIGAGFLRNLVWDHLHDYAALTPLNDVDIIYYDPHCLSRDREAQLEQQLKQSLPDIPWSVRNQARMHLHNQDSPYHNTCDAMLHWLETPTATACRLKPKAGLVLSPRKPQIEFLAPYGLEDLMEMRVAPTHHALSRPDRQTAYGQRLAKKNWKATWPQLKIAFL